MARKLALLILVLVVLDVPFVSAQVSTSSITGAVTDASGAVVAGAKVEAKNEETGWFSIKTRPTRATIRSHR